jgi:hypothetical protein
MLKKSQFTDSLAGQDASPLHSFTWLRFPAPGKVAGYGCAF